MRRGRGFDYHRDANAIPLPPMILSLTQHARVLIIAELSANHGGSLDRAVETIHAAIDAGADAIKLQTYTPETMTLDSDRAEFQIRGGPWDGRTLFDLYREAHTPWEWHARLFEIGAQRGVPVFSTPFDASAVDLLESLGAPAYKIASFELTDLELLEKIARTRKPIIASTGMASLEEIAEAVDTIRRTWAGSDPGLALLKCVSAYPAQPADMHLRAMPELARRFGVVPGLSDHTRTNAVAITATALGARVIEKHFTLRRADGGPDSGFSLEPAELKALVRDVRDAEAALGEVRFGCASDQERDNLRFRRSIFAIRDIKKGEPFSRDNVRVIRPGYGLPPKRLPQVLGRQAAADVSRGTPLREEHLG